MPIVIDGTGTITGVNATGISTAQTVNASNITTGTLASANGGTGTASGVTGFKNRIINGQMVLDQRNAGVLINPAVAGYTVDRWYYYQSQTSKGTIGQNAGSVTPPVGFTNYLGFTSTSAYSINSTDQFFIQQAIEGFNFADLGFGSANAKTVTLSFQVYSSLTGTFGGALQNSAANRNYPFTYTISSANTWTSISITIVGDTTGTWLTTNGTGIKVVFSLGSGTSQSAAAGAWTGTSFITSATGATSVVATNGATFYLTGVQLEVGSTATSFDYRPYGTELALCQRYCWKYGGIANQYLNGPGLYADGNTIIFGSIPNPVSMRAGVSLTVVGSPRVSVNGGNSGGWTPTISGPGGDLNSWIDMTKAGHGVTAGVTTNLYIPSTSDYFLFTAEL